MGRIRICTVCALLLSITFRVSGQIPQNKMLGQILTELSAQRNVMISFSPTFTNSVYPKDASIEGDLEVVLGRLLKDSDLDFRKVAANNYYIYKKERKIEYIPEKQYEFVLPPLPAEHDFGGKISIHNYLIIVKAPSEAITEESVVATPTIPAAGNNAPKDSVEINIGFPQIPAIISATGKKTPRLLVKSNLLYNSTATINLGMEVGLGKRTTLDVSGNYNNWTFSGNRKFKHWFYQPEFRLWNCERFNGGFWGLHAHYGQYNVGGMMPWGIGKNSRFADHRYEGWFAGGGVSYGYHWMLGGRWGLEASLGLGYAYLEYDKFGCERCSEKLASQTKHYFGPTKIGLTLIWAIK